MKRAFTLIELLVVIAIIAILAAILFPVFAQAKAAAKASASLSNTKQLTLGNIMYSADADDTCILQTAWNNGSPQLCFSGGACFSTWGWLSAPYVKSGALFTDPSAPGAGLAANQQNANYQTFYSDYGMNGAYLSDVVGASPQKPNPISMTAAAAPAETIFLGAKYSRPENTSGSLYGTGFPPEEGQLSNVQIDPPDCRTSVPWCHDGWGTGGFHQSTLKLPEAAGGLTGGLSLRVAGNGIVSFLDGHTKSMKAGAIAAGTNWNRTLSAANLVVTDKTKYLWDTQ